MASKKWPYPFIPDNKDPFTNARFKSFSILLGGDGHQLNEYDVLYCSSFMQLKQNYSIKYNLHGVA